jgi:hypothetical protein
VAPNFPNFPNFVAPNFPNFVAPNFPNFPNFVAPNFTACNPLAGIGCLRQVGNCYWDGVYQCDGSCSFGTFLFCL